MIEMAGKLPFLKIEKGKIVDEGGDKVLLKGVSLGGWLMMEGYMMYGRNIPEREFKETFARALGKDALDDFTRSFRDNFIQESDIEIIKEWGANCVRIPFNYRLIEFEDRPYSFNEEGMKYLERAVEWCRRHGLYCILDMHAAPGAQNPDWHSDCSGEPRFFYDQLNQERYFRLWRFLAEVFRDNSAVAGYDVLNEPVLNFAEEHRVKDVYEKVTKEIRDIDKKHILFLEGTNWGVRIDHLGKPADDNTAYSIHTYPPPEYVFNWEIDLTYPGKVHNINWNKSTLEMLARPYKYLMEEFGMPIYVGEFGVNWRGGEFGEVAWLRDILSIFEKFNLHWTYWTYKTVANSIFPDGVYRYLGNPPWVNRKGPVSGWETFYSLWPKERNNIIRSWRTSSFARNDRVCNVLKNHF